MKIVLAIEGTDGSGKSSLLLFIKRLCEQQGLAFTQVRRRGDAADAVVVKLSRLLADDARFMCPPAELAVRIAREYLRADAAAAVPAGIVVLDRFVLSILSLARTHGRDADHVLPMLRDLTARAHLHATVFVQCPFDVALARVRSRHPAYSTRESHGEKILRRMAEVLEEEFHRGALTGQRWLVDNSEELPASQEQLMDYLLPYVTKRQ